MSFVVSNIRLYYVNVVSLCGCGGNGVSFILYAKSEGGECGEKKNTGCDLKNRSGETIGEQKSHLGFLPSIGD